MPHRHHLLVCTKEGEGRCASKGGFELFMRFRQEARRAGLDDDVLVTQCGCTGQHDRGPTVIVHPDGLWYQHVTPDDVEAIVREHLVLGHPVARLINPMQRCGPGPGEPPEA